MSLPPKESLPSLDELAAEAFHSVQRDQAAGLIRAPQEVRCLDHEDFFSQIRKSEKRLRVVTDKLRKFLKKYRLHADYSHELNTVQSARICAFENEKGTVFVSAAVVATIIARCEGDAPIVIRADIPVIWIAEQDMIQVVGSASWDAVIQRLGYSLLSISFYDWSDERLLAAIRQVFPHALLQPLDHIDETNGP
jgi:hypothetical protein